MTQDSEEATTGPLIVIPCLNEAGHIGSVLAAILSDPIANRSLIVVADGGSSDGTQQVVADIASSSPQVRLMHNPGRIQSAGLNLAVCTFGDDRTWLLRMDAHAEYPEHFASKIIMEAQRQGAQSVVVSMRSVGVSCFQRAAAAAQNTRLGTGGAAHRMGAKSGWVEHGHHALMQIEAYRRVGGYDEGLATNEDVDLDLRLGAVGAKIWLSVENEIGYYPRSTASALWRQYFRIGMGRGSTFLKHRYRPQLRQLALILLFPAVAVSILSFWFPLFSVPAVIWAGICLGYGALIGLEQRSVCCLASGPAAMIMHLSWSAGFWTRLARQDR